VPQGGPIQQTKTDETKEQLQTLLAADEGIAVTSLLPNLKRFLREEDQDDVVGSTSSDNDPHQSSSKHSFLIRMKDIMVNAVTFEFWRGTGK
jgi:hypothetical protein